MKTFEKGLPLWRRASMGLWLSGGHVPSISTLVFAPQIADRAGLPEGLVSGLLLLGGLVGALVMVGWLGRWYTKRLAVGSMFLLGIAFAKLAASPDGRIAAAMALLVGFLSMGVEPGRTAALGAMHPDRSKRLRQAVPLQVPNIVAVALTWAALEQLSGERHSGWLSLHASLWVVPFLVMVGAWLCPPSADREEDAAADHGSLPWLGAWSFASCALHAAFSTLVPHLAFEHGGATGFGVGRVGSVFGLLAFVWLSVGRNGGRRCEPRTAIVWGSLLALAGALGLVVSGLATSGTAFTIIVVAASWVFLPGIDAQLLTLDPLVSGNRKAAATARVCEPLGALFFPGVMVGIWPLCPPATHVPIVLGLVAIAAIVNVVAVRRWLASAGWSGKSEAR